VTQRVRWSQPAPRDSSSPILLVKEAEVAGGVWNVIVREANWHSRVKM